MDWKQYEREIANYFQTEYPDAKITPHTTLLGKFSRVEREIDLLIEDGAADFAFRIAVDAKHRGERIDVKDVEQFLGMLRDISVDVGVMIAPRGYSQAAISRAHFDDSRLELDVLNFADLKLFQGETAIPYSGDVGVLMSAPFGWIIDATQGRHWPACLYQRGLELEQATNANEWMYVKFSKRDQNHPDLAALLQTQEKYLLDGRPDAEITFLGSVQRPDDAKTAIRCYKNPEYPCPEFTGFVEFEKFIFFCILFSPEELREKNLRKLRYLLRRVVPLKVAFERKG
jgi:hypothetical protein